MSDKSSNVPNARSEIVREICCSSTSDAHSHEYLVVPLSDETALQIFGSRVFDVLRKRWLEDDYLVYTVREITSLEAAALRLALPSLQLQFDFTHFRYSLITSQC